MGIILRSGRRIEKFVCSRELLGVDDEKIRQILKKIKPEFRSIALERWWYNKSPGGFRTLTPSSMGGIQKTFPSFKSLWEAR